MSLPTSKFPELPERLTPEWVERCVEHVRIVGVDRCDDEGGHSDEDDLYEAILRAIAQGTCDDPPACAAAALKTKSLKFNRWCA